MQWLIVIVFMKLGVLSIGGGYPLIPLLQETLVKQYGWLSEGMLQTMIAISQVTPGPLAVNIATFVGFQLSGVWSAFLATVSLVSVGVAITLFWYRMLMKYEDHICTLLMMRVLKVFALGLIASAIFVVGKMTFAAEGKPEILFIFCAVVGLLLYKRYQLGPVAMILLSGVFGFVFL